MLYGPTTLSSSLLEQDAPNRISTNAVRSPGREGTRDYLASWQAVKKEHECEDKILQSPLATSSKAPSTDPRSSPLAGFGQPCGDVMNLAKINKGRLPGGVLPEYLRLLL